MFKNIQLKRNSLSACHISVENLQQEIEAATFFVKKIESGELHLPYPEVAGQSANENSLAGALVSMRDQLQQLKKSEQQRQWAVEGLAKFNDILRLQGSTLEEICDQLLGHLIKYLKANQGAIFVVNDERECLQMKGCYAYDRKKFLNVEVGYGHGLVGQAFLERETIYLTQVPENYMNITSGLGNAAPRNLVLVPLKSNETVHGILEVASFEVLQPHEVAFLEKLGESIAATISMVRTNEKTAKLLQQSRQQSEELRAQEEELKQNLEEMQATQEELARKEAESSSIIKALKTAYYVVELSDKAEILAVNDSFAHVLGVSSESSEILGRPFVQVALRYADEMEHFAQLWEQVLQGKSVSAVSHLKVPHLGDVWLFGTYSPVFDNRGRLLKVLLIIADITESKQQEEALRTTQASLKVEKGRIDSFLDSTSDNIFLLDADLKIVQVNKSVQELFTGAGILIKPGMSISQLLTPEIHANSTEALLAALRGQSTVMEQRYQMGEINGVYDMRVFPLFSEGAVVGVGIVTRDITDRINMEEDIRRKNEELTASDEEMRQNLEELQAMQETLEIRNREIEEIRAKEKARADHSINSQKKIMENYVKRFKLREQELMETINKLQAAIKADAGE